MPAGSAQPQNHPKKGSSILVSPIRHPKDIRAIKSLLDNNPKYLCIFILGINTALRASDLLKLKIGDVKYLLPGEHFTVKEKKTKKDRIVTLNTEAYKAVQNLIATMPDVKDSDFLFQSRKGGGPMSTQWLNLLVKKWCRAINLNGANYGSHTLRKTFGYTQRTVHGVSVVLLMEIFNHSSQRVTMRYLGIQAEEIRDVYMNVI